VQAFLSEELSEEIQIRGRTSRQKNKGSFQMILLAKDLAKFGITNHEIKNKERGIVVRVGSIAGSRQQTMYEFLHAKRATFLEKSAAIRRQFVVDAKQLHDKSTEFQKSLWNLSESNPANVPERKILEEKCLEFLESLN